MENLPQVTPLALILVFKLVERGGHVGFFDPALST
jgi:hypothetical protein